jgi:hypothetical protein
MTSPRNPLRSRRVVLMIVTITAMVSFMVTQGLQRYSHASGLAGRSVSPPVAKRVGRASGAATEEVGKFHKPLRVKVDFPGIDQPELLAGDQVDLAPATEVIGVEIDGQACALVLNAMSEKERHVVNLMLNDSPVSVSYCNLSQCVRVLTSDSSSTIPLGVGGLDIESRMVLLFKGQRYSQDSKDLPLQDIPFSRLEWGTWKLQHPETKIYLGESGARVEP